jgi:DNA-binding FadR family transcriptional regulator
MAIPAALEKVEKKSLSGAVFDQLVDKIVGGAFPVGTPLPSERQLCLDLGVSRTAVREALARLAQLRLIAVRQGGETLVLDFRTTAGLDLLPRLLRHSTGHPDLAVVRSGLEMRAALAPDIARLAASHVSEPISAALDAVVSEMAKPEIELAALQALSLKFWGILVAASGNLAYQLAFNSLRDAVGALGEVMANAQENELRDLDGYRRIARAVRRGDHEAAAEEAREHIAIGLRGLLGMTGLPKKPRRPGTTATGASRIR